MKAGVHKSRNYMLIRSLFDRIQQPLPTGGAVRYGIGIISAQPGLGKTMGLDMLAYETNQRVVTTPCETIMSENSFLQEVLRNLRGETEETEEKRQSSSVLMSQVAGYILAARGNKKPVLFLDECQYLRYGNRKIWHVIKRISDRALVPVICAGRPEGFEVLKQLEYNDFGWRTRERVELEPLLPKDMHDLMTDLAECEYSTAALKLIFDLADGSYGSLTNHLYEIERQAKRAKIETIEPEHIRQWRGV